MTACSRRSLLSVLCVLGGSLHPLASVSASKETVRLKLGRTLVTLEVADNEIARRIGLMHRASLPADHGMLFVFDRHAPRALWMKNTLMDLDAAFVDTHGRIVKCVTMKKGTTDLHACAVPVACIVEMRAGWFADHGLAKGDAIDDLRRESLTKILARLQ